MYSPTSPTAFEVYQEREEAEAARKQAELWKSRESILPEEREAQVRLNSLLQQRDSQQRRERQAAEEAERQRQEAEAKASQEKVRSGILRRLGIR
jgi:hypothetical protein